MEKHLSIDVISCPGEKYEIVFTVTSYDGAFRGDIAEERSLDGALAGIREYLTKLANTQKKGKWKKR